MNKGAALDDRLDVTASQRQTEEKAEAMQRRPKQEPAPLSDRGTEQQGKPPEPHQPKQAHVSSARAGGADDGSNERWSTRVCNEPGCFTVPSYGNPGTKRKFCKLHAKEGMINVASKKCNFGNCSKVATYGVPGGKRERCATHAEEHQSDIFNKKCVVTGCNLRATFGVEGGKRSRCARHICSSGKMVNFNRRRCAVQGCKEVASHGVRRGRKQVYCANHADRDMVCISNKRCIHPGCMLAALHTLGGGPGPRDFCARHSKGVPETETASSDADATSTEEAKPKKRGPHRKKNTHQGEPPSADPTTHDEAAGGTGGAATGRRGRRFASRSSGKRVTVAAGDVSASTQHNSSVTTTAKRSEPDGVESNDVRKKRGRPKIHSEDEHQRRTPQMPTAVMDKVYPRQDLMAALASAGPGAGLRLLLQTESGWMRWDWQTALQRPLSMLASAYSY